ncbi:hypothetical protein D9758_011470 [Tetrapyrgos nigripes]|uniref:Origin recognition complex subunit 3 N-terminal domain-containing protein n=1 Tax=Tetrapyrgos nigripes TaxID=182062 RepID=A0A8H5FQY4_9AGAR|nr:hypothetical protein D9758_011470 [Tetrapyrgos nigripes]
MTIDLDDSNQSVFFISCAESDDEEQEQEQQESSSTPYGDLPNGGELRWEAYRAAWAKCLERVQAIVQALYEPAVKQVVKTINNAYVDTLPGIPHEELPMVVVSGMSCAGLAETLAQQGVQFTDPSNITLLSAIIAALTQEQEQREEETAPPPFITHLSPSECPNITTAMRNLISGFIVQSTGEKYTSSARSLAPYDIQVLKAWYNFATTGTQSEEDLEPEPASHTRNHSRSRKSKGKAESRNDDSSNDNGQSKPKSQCKRKRKLLIVLRDFEQFDPNVISDIIYICSLHIPALPLVFLVSLSSPSTSTSSLLKASQGATSTSTSLQISSQSYLHTTYPRSTLSLLRLHQFGPGLGPSGVGVGGGGIGVPLGRRLLGEIFEKTFIDLVYDPLLVLGPTVLEFLLDYCMKWNCDVDSILNILQSRRVYALLDFPRLFLRLILAHLKHFTTSAPTTTPTVLFLSTPPSSTWKNPASFEFLDTLMGRLHDDADVDTHPQSTPTPQPEPWDISNITSLTKSIDKLRESFYDSHRHLKLGFRVLRLVDGFLVGGGIRGCGRIGKEDWRRARGRDMMVMGWA